MTKLLLQAAPEAASVANDAGQRPLHLVVCHHEHMTVSRYSSLPVIEALLATAPECALIADAKGCTPLHLELSGAAEFSIAKRLLDVAPAAAALANADGDYPLHLAVCYSKRSSSSLVLPLLAAAPEAARYRSREGVYPLLAAISRQYDAPFITALLNAAPEVALQADENGNMAIHGVLQANCSVFYQHVIVALIKLASPSLSAANQLGQLPLHIAVCEKPTNEDSWLPTGRKWTEARQQSVLAVLAAKPDAALSRDNDGNTPLHLAVQARCYWLAVKVWDELLTAGPQAATIANAAGQLPLGMAVEKLRRIRATATVFELDCLARAVAKLMELNPAAVSIVDEHGSLPVHWILRHLSDEPLILGMLTQAPLTVLISDKDGRLPLHLAVEKLPAFGGLETAWEIFKLAPEAAGVADAYGNFPLHTAVKLVSRAEDLRFIQAILKAAPEAVAQANRSGDFPLHLALEHGCDNIGLAILEELTAAAPHVLFARNADDRLPLHIACRSNQDGKIISALLALDPAAAAEKDGHGDYALHLALGRQYLYGRLDLAVLKDLLVAAPYVAALPSGSGKKFPLELVCSTRWLAQDSTLLSEFMKLLVDSAPDVVMQKNKMGNLPIHIALWSNTDLKVLAQLVHPAPKTLFEMNSDGLLPLHVACQFVPQTVPFLLEQGPQALCIPTSDGKYALEMLFSARFDRACSLAVEKILVAAPGCILMPSAADGRWPLPGVWCYAAQRHIRRALHSSLVSLK